MLVAAFNAGTAWVGKTIAFDDGRFTLEGFGEVDPAAVMEYDAGGVLDWAYEGLREWAASLIPAATEPMPTVQPAAQAASAPAALVVALVLAACVLTTLVACGGPESKSATKSPSAKYGALSPEVIAYMEEAIPLLDNAFSKGLLADAAFSQGGWEDGITYNGQAYGQWSKAKLLGSVPVQTMDTRYSAADRALADKYRAYRSALSRFVFVENSSDSMTSPEHLALFSAVDAAEKAFKALYNELRQ